MAPAVPWIVLSAALVAFLWIDLKLFARGREPGFREAALWSLGWLALSLLAALAIWPLRGGEDAAEYLTVYLVERSLSLDNLFVFVLLGLRALFVLVEGLARRFRYLDETIAVVLAIVGVKLLLEELVKVGPLPSLAIIAAAFAAGITASLVADSRYARRKTNPST